MKNFYQFVLIRIFLVISMSAVMIQNSFAEPERKAIRIACVEYPPFTLKDGTGASADMLNELFDKMGYNISIEVYPLGRVISMVNKGEIEAARLFPQTDPKVTVAIPIQYSSAVFVYKKSMFPSGINFKTLSDLQQYRIGALSNSKWTVKLLEEGAGLQLDFAPANDLNLKKIYLERIHLLPLIHITALSLIESVFPNKQEEFGLTKSFNVTPVCLIFSTKYPGNQKIINDVKKHLTKIDMHDILQKHFGKYFAGGIIPPYMVTGNNFYDVGSP